MAGKFFAIKITPALWVFFKLFGVEIDYPIVRARELKLGI